MKKTFTVEGTEYTVEACTAIAASIGDTERQNALLVETTAESGEKFQYVVFGYDMLELEDEAAFLDMCEDSGRWDSDWETLETVVC